MKQKRKRPEDRKNKLDTILYELGWSQEDLAEKSSVAQSEISKIMNDNKPGLQLRTAFKISKATEKKIEEIWPDGI